MFKLALAAAAVLALSASAALAAPGSASDPIPLKMQVGTDVVTVHGVLRQNLDCCAYTFKAAAGQQLYYKVAGAATRLVITSPWSCQPSAGFRGSNTVFVISPIVLVLSPNIETA